MAIIQNRRLSYACVEKIEEIYHRALAEEEDGERKILRSGVFPEDSSVTVEKQKELLDTSTVLKR
jgi:hypothetical protein